MKQSTIQDHPFTNVGYNPARHNKQLTTKLEIKIEVNDLDASFCGSHCPFFRDEFGDECVLFDGEMIREEVTKHHYRCKECIEKFDKAVKVTTLLAKANSFSVHSDIGEQSRKLRPSSK
jgi:hypothetical protein